MEYPEFQTGIFGRMESASGLHHVVSWLAEGTTSRGWKIDKWGKGMIDNRFVKNMYILLDVLVPKYRLVFLRVVPSFIIQHAKLSCPCWWISRIFI